MVRGASLRSAYHGTVDSSLDGRRLRETVDGLEVEPDRMRRRLVALGALTEHLAPDGLEPILVGGCALELYTDGGYTTGDVDLALPHGEVVDAAFADLGFDKRGRFWVREDLELVFEAPAPAGLPGETAPRTVSGIESLRVVVLGVEDLLIDRLRAWVHRRSTEDRRWAHRLAALYARELDWEYLRERVDADAAERVALDELREMLG